MSQILTVQRRPQVVGGRASVDETYERRLASRESVVGLRWGMIRFNNCRW
jgi:hypothetical protein